MNPLPHFDDAHWMTAALTLGRRGAGRVWPNPAVGAVVVKDGRVLGRGWTAPGGRPHAEPLALAQAGVAARGATLYVTLEPCAHHGQTPPCAAAVIGAGIARCVVAITDPDPRVSGRGLQMLRDAGVEVRQGVCAGAARRDLAGFLSRIERGRPRVTLKLAQTLDGRIATATGESQWITGQTARHWVHADRMRHDAVMVGAGTVRADNPSLTVRHIHTPQNPVRVVVSRRLDFDGDALKDGLPEAPLWLCHGPDAPLDKKRNWQTAGARCFECPVVDHHLDLTHVLQTLGQAGLTSVYCEGGGTLAGALLSLGLVDDVLIYGAGLAIGSEGRPSLGALGLDRLSDAPAFELIDMQCVGSDVRQLWGRKTVYNSSRLYSSHSETRM